MNFQSVKGSTKWRIIQSEMLKSKETINTCDFLIYLKNNDHGILKKQKNLYVLKMIRCNVMKSEIYIVSLINISN